MIVPLGLDVREIIRTYSSPNEVNVVLPEYAVNWV